MALSTLLYPYDDMVVPNTAEFQHRNMNYTTEKNAFMFQEVRIVLIGKTGVGRSSTGNTISNSQYLNKKEETSIFYTRTLDNSRGVKHHGIHTNMNYTNEKNAFMMDPDITRILLIGKTGTGKSRLGNTLIGEKRFSESNNLQPLHDRTESKSVPAGNSIFGPKICVVDTPGLFDTNFSSEQVMYEIRRCIPLTTPGPHAIILTVKAGRLTREDIEVFETYIHMFGESMLKYTVVVFTHFDHSKHIKGKTRDEAIEDFVKSFPETMNRFLKRINNRYTMVDTKGTDVEKETNALIFEIARMITDNKNDFYSYQHFIDSRKSQLRVEGLVADENRRQKKKKNRRQLTTSFCQKTIKRTRSRFERETDASMLPDSKRKFNCRA